MKKRIVFPYVAGAAAAAVVLALGLYLGCPALNVHNPGLWWLLDGGLLVFVLVSQLVKANSDYRQQAYRQVLGKKKNRKKKKENAVVELRFSGWGFLLPGVLAVVILLITAAGGRLFHASDYARILSVKEADFTGDLAESVGTDSIALMDTASAKMLGDREIGALSDVVSQFDVSDDYTQIDRGGRPLKVAALEYAGFFKWLNNKEEGVRGYVTVDPVSMSASFHRAEGMRYVPSACFSQDARRYLRMKYPTKMMDNLHFEIDEEGHPYYVASVLQKTVALFGGKTVEGCVTLDPVTGDTALYGLADVPRWIDVVYHGDLICTQYNWFGSLRNGFLNSLFAKKGCQRVTTYRAAEDEDSGDRPVSDYGYVAKDGDIWIYTGVTSVNGDSSNVGFLLANERTGESRFYAVSGADENSAMTAAEGEVQEKGYQASFPSLINVGGAPTYIMVLKDSGGLVKLYAAVNVAQYNLVATAATQAECIEKYRALPGLSRTAAPEEERTETLTVTDVKYIDIDGNTYIYLIGADGALFRAKAAEHEELLFVKPGDAVTLTCAGKEILSVR